MRIVRDKQRLMRFRHQGRIASATRLKVGMYLVCQPTGVVSTKVNNPRARGGDTLLRRRLAFVFVGALLRRHVDAGG